MAFLCCCKSSKRVKVDEGKDVQTGLLNAKEENDHATPNDIKLEPMVSIQVTGVVDIGGKFAVGLAKLPGSIYILCRNPSSIAIHCDKPPYERTGEVSLDELETPWDLASSIKSSCLYMTDCRSNRVYKMTSPLHEVTSWLEGVSSPHTLTVTDPDDQVLVVRYGSPSGLVIYGPDAEKIRQIELPDEIEYPKHAVRSSAGNFVVSGKAKGSEIWGVFEVSVDGEILRRLTQLGTESKHLTESYHLAVDSADRLIVADCWNDRVLMIDAGLNRSQELPPKDSSGLRWPWRLHYVASDNQMLVLQHAGKVGRDEETHGAEEKKTTAEGEAKTGEEKTEKDGVKETEKQTENETAEEKNREKDDEKEEKSTENDKKTEIEGVQTATVNEKKTEEDDKKKGEEEAEKKEEDKGKVEVNGGNGHAFVYIFSYL